MTVTQAHPGSECAECHRTGRYVDARRAIVDDQGKRTNLCLNCAAKIIHANDLYDVAMNPLGKIGANTESNLNTRPGSAGYASADTTRQAGSKD